MIQLKEGSKAPLIEGIDQNGNAVKLADFSGKKIISKVNTKDHAKQILNSNNQ